MKKLALPGLTGLVVAAGFIVGYGIGRSSAAAQDKNTDFQIQSGKAILTFDLAGTLKDGISDWWSSL